MRQVMYKKQNKWMMFLVIAVMLLQAASVSAMTPVEIQVDGSALPPDTQFDISEGRVMLQMNEVFEALGAQVEWMESSRSILILKDNQAYTLSLESGSIQTPDGPKMIEPKPYISQGRTMIPLRFISELFGYQVNWNESQRRVTITAQAIEIDIDQEADEQETIDDDRTVLSYEEAVERSIQNSYDLENRLIAVRQLEEQRERSEEAFVNTRPISDRGFLADLQNKQALLGLIQTEINLEISKMQAEIEEERIAFTVQSIFHDIVNLENDLNFMEMALDNNEENVRIQTLKLQQGLISQASLNAAQEELVQFKARMDSVKRSRTNAYEQLQVMTGLEDIHSYRVEFPSMAFEKMADVNITTHMSQKSSADPYVKLQEKQIERAEKNLQLYVYTGMDEPYEVRRLTLESEKNNLSLLKSRLQESLQSRYQNIRQIENQYEIAQSQLKTMKEQMNILEVQFDLGMVTKQEIEEMKAAHENQENEVTRLMLQHEQLKVLFEAPYLMPDYLN